MFPARTKRRVTRTPFFFYSLLWVNSCTENNEYPLNRYRNAADLQFQAAASYTYYDAINEAAIASAKATQP